MKLDITLFLILASFIIGVFINCWRLQYTEDEHTPRKLNPFKKRRCDPNCLKCAEIRAIQEQKKVSNATSDHRPVLATFTLSGSAPQTGSRAAILERIERIESELRDLKALIEQLPE